MTLIAYFRDEIFISRKVGFVFRRGGEVLCLGKHVTRILRYMIR